MPGQFISLRARVGADPLVPPTTGWLFWNSSVNYEYDPCLICTPRKSDQSCRCQLCLDHWTKTLSPRIKSGRSIENFSYPMITTSNKYLFQQLLNSQALDPLQTIRVTEWEGLNLSLGRREMDPLSTNKFTQEKCQRMAKFCCTGGKTKDII